MSKPKRKPKRKSNAQMAAAVQAAYAAAVHRRPGRPAPITREELDALVADFKRRGGEIRSVDPAPYHPACGLPDGTRARREDTLPVAAVGIGGRACE